LFRDAPRLSGWNGSSVFLRHDIDVSMDPAIRMAAVERDCGASSTYMFMTRSELYDVTRSGTARQLREIAAMGHEVGVHFDCPSELRNEQFSLDAIESLILEDCERLENSLGEPVRSISFHRPIPGLLGGPLLVAGKINAYAAELIGWYLSDSKGSWRAGEPLLRLQDGSGTVLQLLTHPIWWGEEHAAPPVRLESFFRTETRAMQPAAANEFGQTLAATIPGILRSGQSHTE
jgi:hypothetical protein